MQDPTVSLQSPSFNRLVYIKCKAGSKAYLKDKPQTTSLDGCPTKYNVKLVIPRHIIIADVDIKNGADPTPFLEYYDRYHGPLVQTPSGGFHFYYRNPFPGMNHPRTFVDLPNVEWFSAEQGGDIMFPPSVVDDKKYEWLNVWDEDSALLEPPFDLTSLVVDDALDFNTGKHTAVDPDYVQMALLKLRPYAEEFASSLDWLKLVTACHSASGGDDGVLNTLFSFFGSIGYNTAKDLKETSTLWENAHNNKNGSTVKTLLYYLGQHKEDPACFKVMGQIMELIDEQQPDVDISELFKEPRPEMVEDEEDEGYEISEVPLPSGKLGELVADVHACCRHQYNEISLVTALGLLAGIVGRRYNISNTGVNVYLTLVMSTGAGKDQISNYMEQVLYRSAQQEKFHLAGGFKGKKSYTGAKALLLDMANNPCMCCLFTEAGFLLKSQSGDMIGLTRAILDLYTKSGQYRVSEAEGYSPNEKGNNNIPTICAPSLSIINESTPDVLLRTLAARNAAITGELARQSLFRVNCPRPYMNTAASNANLSLWEEFLTQGLKAATGAAMPPEVVNINIHTLLLEFDNECTDKANEFANIPGRELEYALATRASIKAFKYAALAAIAEKPLKPVISDEMAHWAMALVKHEVNTISALFSVKEPNSLEAIVTDVVAPTIKKLLSGHYTCRNKSLSAEDMRAGIFRYSPLSQALLNNNRMNAFNRPLENVTGLERALSFMVRTGLIEQIIAQKTTIKTQFRVTSDFIIRFGTVKKVLRREMKKDKNLKM